LKKVQKYSKSKRNILLTGMGSASNKGTAATIISTVKHLTSLLPDADLYVELFFPEKQRKLIDIENENVHIIEPPLQSPIRAIFSFLIAIVQWPILKLTHGRLQANFHALGIYRRMDSIINVGGDGFVNIYGERITERIFRYLFGLYPLLVAILLDKPVIFHSSSLGPFGVFKPVMKFVLERSQLVTVRDQLSLKHLKEAGIDISNVYVTADPAFLIEIAPDELVEKTLKREGIDLEKIRNNEIPIVGVVLSKLRGFRGEILRSKYNYLIKIFAETIDKMIETLGAQIIFISRSSGVIRKKSNDVYVGMDIMLTIKNKENFSIIKGDYSPELIKGLLSKCDALMSFHMHPLIFALPSYVPCVIIAFSDKAYGLMQKVDLIEYVCDIRFLTSELLFRKVCKALSDKEKIQRQLKEKMKYVEKEALSSYMLIKEAFEPGPPTRFSSKDTSRENI